MAHVPAVSRRILTSLAFAASFVLAPLASHASAQDLIMNGGSMTLGGVHRYVNVSLTNGAVIRVPPFDGTDRTNTGNLVIIAQSITIDATSRIDARGSGYATVQCGNGGGPTAAPASGGRGGCAVSDSGGGGAHFGNGGRGTKDCFVYGSATMCEFPQEFEEDCGNTLSAGMCTSRTDCRNLDAAPTVAGQSYWHSIYDTEFGAAGGDKGCRDGDGFGAQPAVGGAGGGRVVLVGLNATSTGTVTINGTVTAHGRRGCGTGNDSGGGGAGGSIFIVGDQVQVGASALITAGGGRGGDTFSGAVGQPDYTDCPAGAQTGGTCDDCGGGGGGGIIEVHSRTSTFAYGATFDVAGALGGVCPICAGEAGGGAGELQLDGAYVGEICDGYDNDFDGMTDESLGTVACGLGTCQANITACPAGTGSPAICTPTVTTGDATCVAPHDAARPRIAVILDTSGSMLLDLAGYPTFGDGSVEHPGLDHDGNGRPDDSRLYLARTSLDQVISAYPEIDFALARYHQDEGLRRFCQAAAWLDCAGIPATYDNPTDNTGSVVCNAPQSATTTVPVRAISTGDECINYAGSCGGPRRGADILAGFGTRTRDLVRWLDGRETGFDASTTSGDYCHHATGGDCEVRGTGGTPLAGSLQAVEDYVVPIRATDSQAACRSYTIILVTDGAESCNGNPAMAAAHLFGTYGIQTYVIAVSVLPQEEASLNAIAVSGSGGARTTATFVRAPGDLVPALTSIIEGSLHTERCNGLDDDCDAAIDEDFPSLGTACHDSMRGVCRSTGAYVCTPDQLGTQCNLTMPGVSPSTEVCNGMDDDCDDAIDEALTCTGMTCVPSGPEVCDGIDNDCNGLIDETDPAIGTPCGSSMGICMPGMMQCVAGMLRCIGGVDPRPEVCNGLDDDCDGTGDDMAPCPTTSQCIGGACRQACNPAMEFPCPPDFACEPVMGLTGDFCVPTACAACTATEICRNNTCIDPCMGVTCTAPQTCVAGACVDCNRTGCTGGLLCIAGTCQTDPCAGVACSATQACVAGHCQMACGEGDCPVTQRCTATGGCEPDPCAEVTCGTGMFCDAGTGMCRPDPCRGMTCPTGQVCASETGCIANPCTTTHCPAGRTCEVDSRGIPECLIGIRPPPTETESRVLASGGALSCAVGVDHRGATLGLVTLGLALTALARRRTRR